MGVRFRKSIKVGKVFRINISKSGIEYSYGTKGSRKTHVANGARRSTLFFPWAGFSFIKQTRRPHIKKNTNSNENYIDNGIGNHEMINIDNQYPTQFNDLIDDIKNIRRLNAISTVLIGTFLLSAFPLFIITGVLGIISKIYIHKKMAVNVEYEFDKESKNDFNKLYNAWSVLKSNKKIYQVTNSSNISDFKKNAGAKRLIKNKAVTILNKLPWYLNSSIKLFGLNLSRSLVIFLPDKLLIIQGQKIGAMDYADLHMSIATANFIEIGNVPLDTEILDYTWTKVNKDGSRDKRFQSNRRVPICKYGEIIITNNKSNHILAEIMCSNPSSLIGLAQAFKEYTVSQKINLVKNTANI